MQDVGVAHETLKRPPPNSLPGSVGMDADQEEPFHCSTNGTEGVVPASPTATQKLTLAHEAPRITELAWAATPCIWAQAEPFHWKIRGVFRDEPDPSPPATQNDAVTQSTLEKEYEVAPGTVGTPTDIQVEPFHICAEAAWSPKRPCPTAMHQVDVTHETLPVSLYVVGAVIEFGMVDQFDALTCAGAVRP